MSDNESEREEPSDPEPKEEAEKPSQETSGSSEEEHEISFASYQLFVFVACYIGYTLFLYNRRSFTFTLPHVIMEEYFTSYEIGMILACQSVTYAFSKFAVGWATDHYSPRLLFSAGLFSSGFLMVGFTDNDDFFNLMLLAALNGVAQGCGWPPAAKMIRAWYPPTQFGLWWALLTTSTNVISAFGPTMATAIAVDHGWRLAITVPALIAIFMSIVLLFVTIDKPSDVGYEDQLTLGGADQGHWSDLIGSDFMALLAVCYCLTFLVKTSCQDWGQVFLLQDKGMANYAANSYLNSMEFGGMAGCIISGAATDWMVRRGYYFGTGKSPRMVVVHLLITGSFLFLNLFLFTLDTESTTLYIGFLGFCLGFCIYGALSLIGTIAVEVAPIHTTGFAQAIVGIAASFGSALAGMPMTYLARVFDWYAVFMALNFITLGIFFILVIHKDMNATYLSSGGGPPRLKKNNAETKPSKQKAASKTKTVVSNSKNSSKTTTVGRPSNNSNTSATRRNRIAVENDDED